MRKYNIKLFYFLPILIAIISCEKDNIHTFNRFPGSYSDTELQNTHKDSLKGEWRVTTISIKWDLNEEFHPFFFYKYDQDLNLDSTFYNSPTAGSYYTTFTFYKDANRISLSKTYRREPGAHPELTKEIIIKYDNAYPDTSIINRYYNNTSDNINYIWSEDYDTMWRYNIAYSSYWLVDADIDHFQINSGNAHQIEFYPYQHPIMHRTYMPNFISWDFYGDGYKLMKKVIADGILRYENTIDSIADDRVIIWTWYRYNENEIWQYKADWEFFTYNAR